MFKRKKKTQEWELEEVYRIAVRRLHEMENDEENFAELTKNEETYYVELTNADNAAAEAKKLQLKYVNDAKKARETWKRLKATEQYDDADQVMIEIHLMEENAAKCELEAYRNQQMADKCRTMLEVMAKKNTLAQQRTYVEELAKSRKEWQESVQRRKVSPDQMAACGVTLIGFSAPYLIERLGKLANHFKGKVNLPRIFK